MLRLLAGLAHAAADSGYGPNRMAENRRRRVRPAPCRLDRRNLDRLRPGHPERHFAVRARTRAVDRLHRAALAARPGAPWLERWDGDGIIARASTPQSARKLLKTGVPTVDLNDQVRGLGLPQIHSDHAAIARLAAEHLMDRGFRHFAYFGFPVVRMVGAPAGVVHRACRRGRSSDSRGPARPPRLLEPPASLVGR